MAGSWPRPEPWTVNRPTIGRRRPRTGSRAGDTGARAHADARPPPHPGPMGLQRLHGVRAAGGPCSPETSSADRSPCAATGRTSGSCTVACLPDSTPGELEIYCHDGEYGITERNEPAVVLTTADSRLLPAAGPMLTPWIPNQAWARPLVSLLPVNGQPFPPVPITSSSATSTTERAADCRPEQRQLRRDRFVVDRLVDFEPRAVPTPGVTPTPSPFPFEFRPPPLSLDPASVRRERRAPATSPSSAGWLATTWRRSTGQRHHLRGPDHRRGDHP